VTSVVSPLVVSPKQAEKMLSCSHKKLYQLLADGELDSYLDGRSRKIIVASIEARIARKLEACRGEKLKRPA
jgi:hypothetical protein